MSIAKSHDIFERFMNENRSSSPACEQFMKIFFHLLTFGYFTRMMNSRSKFNQYLFSPLFSLSYTERRTADAVRLSAFSRCAGFYFVPRRFRRAEAVPMPSSMRYFATVRRATEMPSPVSRAQRA